MAKLFGKISQVFLDLDIFLACIYLLILILWLVYIVRRLLFSNKILSGTKRHESSSKHSLPVYNANTQVVKYRLLVIVIVLEIFYIITIQSNYAIFAKPNFVWSLGKQEFSEFNRSTSNYSCPIDPLTLAIYKHPTIMLYPTLTHSISLLLLTAISVLIYYLILRYNTCILYQHHKTLFQLVAVVSVQILILILTCTSPYTILLEPVLFFLFFLGGLVVYFWCFNRLKLIIKGRIFEITNFENYSKTFAHSKRDYNRFKYFTYLFWASLILPALFFEFVLYLILFGFDSKKLCIFSLIFGNHSLINFTNIEDEHGAYYEFMQFLSVLSFIPISILILPHLAYVLCWVIDSTKKRPRSLIFASNASLSQPLI